MTLNENIREFRRQRGMTQEALAETMGVSTASVSKWETGQSAPELTALMELADFFQVSVDALLGHELKADPKEAMIQEMEALADQDRFAEAKEAAQKLLRHYPNDYRAVSKAANTYYRGHSVTKDDGDMLYAIELTKRLFRLAEDPTGMKRFELMCRLGNQYENIENWEEARKYYTDSNISGLNDRSLARLLGKEGKNQEAIDATTKVFAENLLWILTDVMNLQNIWRDLGEPEKARAALKWGIGALETVDSSLLQKYKSLDVVLHLQLAGLARENGETEQAAEYGRRAVELARGQTGDTAVDFLTDKFAEVMVSSEVSTPEGVEELLKQEGAKQTVALGKAKE